MPGNAEAVAVSRRNRGGGKEPNNPHGSWAAPWDAHDERFAQGFGLGASFASLAVWVTHQHVEVTDPARVETGPVDLQTAWPVGDADGDRFTLRRRRGRGEEARALATSGSMRPAMRLDVGMRGSWPILANARARVRRLGTIRGWHSPCLWVQSPRTVRVCSRPRLPCIARRKPGQPTTTARCGVDDPCGCDPPPPSCRPTGLGFSGSVVMEAERRGPRGSGGGIPEAAP